MEGTAFNNGWSLVSPTKLSYSDFAGITHIWFSHEHPDHFSPPNLSKIPEEYRRKITVVFHHTKDGRVVKVCKSLGFKIIELPEERPVEIAPGFSIICGPEGLVDSWMAVTAEGKTVLNMNDCICRRPHQERIKRLVGKVDVLMSQFSYAIWIGNINDHASHKKHADRKRVELANQVRIFQPGTLIPFASYVYFCHAENFYMNKCVNQIGDIYRYGTEELKVPTNVLYPGDEWNLDADWDSTESIRKYDRDLQRALNSAPLTSPKYELAALRETAREFARQCGYKNNQRLLKAMPAARIHLSDLEKDVEFSFRSGLTEGVSGPIDISTSSDSLMYCLTKSWGGETLQVNGRYQAPAAGNQSHFFRIFKVFQHNSYGTSLNLMFLGNQTLKKARRLFGG
jgi:UDP-MurNAc hydroxylase